MANRTWKHVQPRSLAHAFELCKVHALKKHRLSVERIAELMGQKTSTVYKWIEEARMPADKIRGFEHICGISLVTKYLAASDHKLLIEMPKARPAKDTDLITTQKHIADAMSALSEFYSTHENPDQALSELTKAMTDMASHRARVERSLEPELDLFEQDDHE